MEEEIFNAESWDTASETEDLQFFSNEEPQIPDSFMDIKPLNDMKVSKQKPKIHLSKVSEEIEDFIMTVLEDKGPIAVGSLLSERKVSGLNKFKVQYSAATRYNPALKWYFILAKEIGKKFSVENDGLVVLATKNYYKKRIKPALGDFNSSLREISPIVDLIYMCKEKFEEREVRDFKSKWQGLQKQANNRAEEDLDLDELEFEPSLDDGVEVMEGAVYLDDSDQVVKEKAIAEDAFSVNYNISALATYFAGRNASDVFIREYMEQRMFKEAQIKEISIAVKMMRLNRTISGNHNTGFVDFNFEL